MTIVKFKALILLMLFF